MKKRKRRKKQRYRVLKAVVGISICLIVVIGIIAFNWTSIQLGMKGYDRDARATLLSLSEEEIEEYLSLDKIIDLSKWDQVNNQHHYYDYELYSSDTVSVEDVVSYVDEFYHTYHTELKELGYDLETQRSLMKQLSLDDFHILTENQLKWKEVEPFIDINGSNSPNVAGEDLFFFIINEKSQLVPLGMEKPYAQISGTNSHGTCNRKAAKGLSPGMYCAARIMSDGWRMKY